jgi:hypothetical protein
MSGWSNDGRAAPNWRSCFHPVTQEGRCTTCKAREVADWRPGRRTIISGAPLGNYAAPKVAIGEIKPNNPVSAKEWNAGPRKAA